MEGVGLLAGVVGSVVEERAMTELHVAEESARDVKSVGELVKVVESSVGEQAATVVKLLEEEQAKGKELVEALVVEAEVSQALAMASESAVVETLVTEYPPPPSQK